ncbi:DUF6708 domain-containing protein [Achromobacter spanius]|uniref:DUF6708 domain-containing protein n=1 Tax=Achromobacter spanius TaxID=217203 RepID=UPI00320B636B
MTKPLLNPPCKGWQRDLPGPNDPPAEAPDIVFGAPNHLDEVYLEIARRSISVRGFLFFLGLFCWGFVLWTVVTSGFISDLVTFDPTQLIVYLSFAAFLLISLSMLRIDFSVPRSEPIRFNRARLKVYVYGFHFVWWNPFTRWYVTTKSYDWDDLRAEAWKQRGATANGGLVINEGVSLAVVKPGTNHVIDRFHLSGSVQTALWAYICTYMQKGPQALTPCDAPMRDANDTYNPITRLAPKVQWPEAMDIESRTAPSSSSGADAAGVFLCGQSLESR